MRLRNGVFVLCAATFALASCSSDSATRVRDDVGSHSLTGSWSGTTVGSITRSYSLSLGDSAVSNGWTTYHGPYQVSGDQDGLGFATARNYVGTSTVEMTLGSDPFHGKFVSVDTIVGTMKIESAEVAIIFAHGI